MRIREAGVEIGRVDVFKADTMPCLEFREPPAGLAGPPTTKVVNARIAARVTRRTQRESQVMLKVYVLSGNWDEFPNPVAIRRIFTEFFTERRFPLN